MTTPPNTPGPIGQPQGGQSPNPYGPPGQQPNPAAPYGSPSPSVPYGSPSPSVPYGSPSPSVPYGSPTMRPGVPTGQPPYGSQPPYGTQSPMTSGPSPINPNTPSGYQPSAATQAKMKRRRIITGTVVGVIVLAVVAFLTLGWYVSSTKTKGSTAAMTGLLTALQNGDAESALLYIDTAGIDSVESEPLLTSAALAGNKTGFTFNPELLKIDSGDSYTYQASVQLNGVNKVVEWSLSEVNGEWLVDSADVLSSVLLDPESPYVINGVPIAAGTSKVLALPGHYAAESGMPLLLYAPTEGAFDIFSGEGRTLSPTLVVAEGVQAQVVSQVQAILNGCAASKDAPTDCNWDLPFNNGVAKNGSITWKLEPADPAATLTLPTSGWAASSSFTNYVTLNYATNAVGEGILDDGSEGTFDPRVDSRQSSFLVDLSGETPVVTLS